MVENITVKTYDEALGSKLSSMIAIDTNGEPLIDVVYSPIDLLYDNLVKRGKSKDTTNTIRFPVISYHRSQGMSISDNYHYVLSNNKVSKYVQLPSEDFRAYQVISVDLPYQIDVISQDEDTAWLLMQEVLFYLHRDMSVDVSQLRHKFNSDDVKSRFTLVTSRDVTDNSSLENELDTGKIYRLTVDVTINDALLVRDVRTSKINTIDVKLIHKED